MNSLKKKFDDYREEPRQASWQQLLKRLDSELPVKKPRRYLLWLLPFAFLATTASWWLFNHQNTQNTTDGVQQKIEAPVANSVADHTVAATTNAPVNIYTATHVNASANHTLYPAPSQHEPAVTQTTPPEPMYVSAEAPDPMLPPTAAVNPVTPPQVNTPAPTEPATQSVPEPQKKPALVVMPLPSLPVHMPLGSKPDSIPDAAPLVKPDAKPENRFMLEIYYAGGISSILYKDPEMTYFDNKTINQNKNLRKDISKFGFSYTTGFSLKANINNSWRFKTGYYFTQVSQNIYYNTQPAQCNCGQGLSLSQIDPNLNESNLTNNADTITKGNSNSFTNKYSLREIPFVLEYAMPITRIRNMSSVINFGFSYMYMSGISSRMPDADNVGFVNSINKTSSASVFPSYKDAYNIILGYGLTYKVKRNIEWSLAPQFKIATTSLSKNTHWLREYPWMFQIGIGVGKRF